MKKNKMYLVLSIVLLFALCSCGGYKNIATNTSVIVHDSVVFKKDTVKIVVEKQFLSTRIDTLITSDTVTLYNDDSVMALSYWRNLYGQLQVKCLQKSYQKNIETEKKEAYKTITKIEERLVEVIKKEVPFWMWSLLVVLCIALIGVIFKR